MMIRNIDRTQLREALDQTNEEFADNIRFKRMDAAGCTRQHQPKFLVTLTVNSSRGPGAKVTYDPWNHRTRHIAAACWHAHRSFFSHLPDGVEVQSIFGTWHKGEPYHDQNIGSQMYPMQASDACECEAA